MKIVDITDKNQIECPKCGYIAKIPPRTLDLKELKRLQAVKKFAEWKKKHGLKPGLGNVRLFRCPKCGEPTLCTDRFTTYVRMKWREKEKKA